jgi:sporulation protein YlmC with PRC-barrel domain
MSRSRGTKRLNKNGEGRVQPSVLRSVRELERFRLATADGKHCGRIKDVYFDDQSWTVQHLVVALDPRVHGQKQVLVNPAAIETIRDEDETILLSAHSDELARAPLATSVLPVCKQYASLALSSPGASAFGRALVGSDPHLRSARAVTNYRLMVQGEFAGTLTDLLFAPHDAEIRYLAIEQVIERRRIGFHILPAAVERFTWASQRVLLKYLQPVEIEHNFAPNFDASDEALVA